MSKDSVGRVVLVATSLCVVCSVLVSLAAVGLREQQDANALLSKQRNVLVALGALKSSDRPPSEKVAELFKTIDAYVVDLASGEESKLEDQSELETEAVEIPAKLDTAGIKQRPNKVVVYKSKKDNEIEAYVLPISGKGLWSTLNGFLSLERDRKTIRGIVFYEHKETPGLGGEVDNTSWLAQWPGKKLVDGAGKFNFTVLKGSGNKLDEHKVDGVTGATITFRGVDGTIRYWIGSEHGYAKYLAKQ